MLREKLKQLRKVLGADIPDDESVNMENVTLEIDGVEHEIDGLSEITATETEIEEMSREVDEGYLQYSSEVVGYDNRELQWDAYRAVSMYVNTESVIDFGCGRGDFLAFYKSEYPDKILDYVGVDMNGALVNAGLDIYPDISLIQTDWFSVDKDLMRDWAINVGSNNLRYDADLTMDDIEYTKKTLQQMYKHCNQGVVSLLASKYTSMEDSLINHDPGALLNWAKEEFGNVAIDHSIGDDVFILIIYKV